MLNRPRLTPVGRHMRGAPRAQRGVSLLVALVVLIAMTLSAIGLMRSMFTSNRIAGNLSFQQSAIQSAEAGIEDAVAWLEANNSGTTLHTHKDPAGPATRGYFASRVNEPAADQSWAEYWTTVIEGSGRVNVLPEDAAGNRVEYIIQRLCAEQGNPDDGHGCAVAPQQAAGSGNSNQGGTVGLATTSQRYYRITARVVGPRNTMSFVQATVAM